MSLLYQPVSRIVMQRNVSGCLTPNNQGESEVSSNRGSVELKNSKEVNSVKESNDANTILSPPLSPYQRNLPFDEASDINEEMNYVACKSPFKIVNYNAYELTLNPWTNLSKNYRKRHLGFLDQYNVISAKEQQYNGEKRVMYKRRNILSSDSDSESTFERIRTRRVAKEKSVDSFDFDGSTQASPSPKKRKVIKPNTTSSLGLQQQSFIDENIPDYSPDVSTLPKGNSRCLKVEWKGQPMDLRDDPNISKLHPAEVLLASILRLPCNVYLDSKRRLFFEKVKRLRSGNQFRRTDAQKACRIDVNKASRLFAAFEKAGWLNDHNFTKYL